MYTHIYLVVGKHIKTTPKPVAKQTVTRKPRPTRSTLEDGNESDEEEDSTEDDSGHDSGNIRCKSGCHITFLFMYASDADDSESSSSEDQNEHGSGKYANVSKVAWPKKPVDYDSANDFEDKDAETSLASIEKFTKGQYVVLMCASDKRAYARFQLRKVVDAKVVALMKGSGRFEKYPPGMYALVEFIDLLPLVSQHRMSTSDVVNVVTDSCIHRARNGSLRWARPASSRTAGCITARSWRLQKQIEPLHPSPRKPRHGRR